MKRATRQRQAIVGALGRMRSHPTADEIYEDVRRDIKTISKGTVYRNLQILKDEGSISVLAGRGARRRYEVDERPHYHFRCEVCGRVFDLDEPVDTEIEDRVAERTGFIVRGHQAEFRGSCRDCRGPLSSHNKES